MTLDAHEVKNLSLAKHVHEFCRECASAAAKLIEEQGEHAFRRDSYSPGHVTASAIVLSPDRSSVLLIHHKKLLRWLQPGGHVERHDLSLELAALREAVEETSVDVLSTHGFLAWVSIDVIPPWKTEPAHLHYDLKYAMLARDWAVKRPSEVTAVAWADVEGLAALDVTLDLLHAVNVAVEHFGAQT
jgi:8-oxo-dGTP pyrophosphatase MutT (NUDIX family)